MTELLIITVLLLIACVLLMRSFVNQKIKIEDLNQQLNLSDQEYVELFNENVKMADELCTFKVLERILNLE